LLAGSETQLKTDLSSTSSANPTELTHSNTTAYFRKQISNDTFNCLVHIVRVIATLSSQIVELLFSKINRINSLKLSWKETQICAILFYFIVSGVRSFYSSRGKSCASIG
jgi:hypothetical protein